MPSKYIYLLGLMPPNVLGQQGGKENDSKVFQSLDGLSYLKENCSSMTLVILWGKG